MTVEDDEHGTLNITAADPLFWSGGLPFDWTFDGSNVVMNNVVAYPGGIWILFLTWDFGGFPSNVTIPLDSTNWINGQGNYFAENTYPLA